MGKFTFFLLEFNLQSLNFDEPSLMSQKKKKKGCEYNFKFSALIPLDSRRRLLNASLKSVKNLFPISIIDCLPLDNPSLCILAIPRLSHFLCI